MRSPLVFALFFLLHISCQGDERSDDQELEAESSLSQGDGSEEESADESESGIDEDNDDANTTNEDDGSSNSGEEESADEDDDDDDDDDDNDDDDDDDDSDDDDDDAGPGAGTCGMGGPKDKITKVELGSTERYYLVGAPDTDKALPLVVTFHGDEGDPEKSNRWHWEPVWKKTKDFILVLAKCPGCTSWYKDDTDANADYVWEVLSHVAGHHNVDVSRIYAIGYSGGSVFLAKHGFEFQEVFAGIQWSCGGGGGKYVDPPKPECKVDGRIVIAEDDFLWDSAKRIEEKLKDKGHVADFVVADCSGHCCKTDDKAKGAWEWFKKRSKCNSVVSGDCAELTDLPERMRPERITW